MTDAGSQRAMIPYGRQTIEVDDVEAVSAALQSDFLTQGPSVDAFERAFAARVGAAHAVAVNSGTAALHASMAALGFGPGDEVIVPPITFTATVNCALFVGATPVFADTTPDGHIDPRQIESKITAKTKAVIAVDYAGWPCDYERILALCDRHGLVLICDACHALGATWNGMPIGSIGRLNCFSFHPVKHIATGEGGMITTDDPLLAEKMRMFRTHGITKDAARFKGLDSDGAVLSPISDLGPWHYEMQALGFNYRMPDLNAALGISQLRKLDRFIARRRAIARRYSEALAGIPHVELPVSDVQVRGCAPYAAVHAFHLFPLLIDFRALGKSRTLVMEELRARGVGAQVHYIPVCLQPYYRERFGFVPGQFPAAESFFARELSIPMFPTLRDDEVERVIRALVEILAGAGA
ncbi:MAG TPA: UDP-4-amino-4,6-dideoxy-N-acetyl-beta-L-altrosamine transaminase [Kiritimatiellia bacterium]|nr:UDP-4-amino-4,6-dideoxy-N-acetyl-beta-L-altrosamine transaminase [Kiritimatiellia bacterium]